MCVYFQLKTLELAQIKNKKLTRVKKWQHKQKNVSNVIHIRGSIVASVHNKLCNFTLSS